MYSEEEINEALIIRHSEAVQNKLGSARVAIAGLGGLGSNVSFSLARMGVGHLHIIDFDKVDITNLNRQQYFLKHIGMKKTDALYEELMEINPYLKIKKECVKVSEENIKNLFENDDIICEAFDLPEAKSMLINGVFENYSNKIVVSGSGMAGYGRSNEIRTRKVAKNFYICGDDYSDIKDGFGLMSARVAICAAHEANLIAELIIDGIK